MTERSEAFKETEKNIYLNLKISSPLIEVDCILKMSLLSPVGVIFGGGVFYV